MAGANDHNEVPITKDPQIQSEFRLMRPWICWAGVIVLAGIVLSRCGL